MVISDLRYSNDLRVAAVPVYYLFAVPAGRDAGRLIRTLGNIFHWNEKDVDLETDLL